MRHREDLLLWSRPCLKGSSTLAEGEIRTYEIATSFYFYCCICWPWADKTIAAQQKWYKNTQHDQAAAPDSYLGTLKIVCAFVGDTTNIRTPQFSGFPTGCCGTLGCCSQYSGVRRVETFFKYIIKHTFWNCHQTSNQIAVGSSLGAVNFIFFREVL